MKCEKCERAEAEANNYSVLPKTWPQAIGGVGLSSTRGAEDTMGTGEAVPDALSAVVELSIDERDGAPDRSVGRWRRVLGREKSDWMSPERLDDRFELGVSAAIIEVRRIVASSGLRF